MTIHRTSRRVLLAMLCVAGLFLAQASRAVEALLELQGSQQYANINESGISFATSAILTFQITQNGAGVTSER